MAKTQQSSLLPFAVETYGGLGKSARKLIKLIASAAEDELQMLSGGGGEDGAERVSGYCCPEGQCQHHAD